MYPHLVIISVDKGYHTSRFKTYGEAVAIYIEMLLHNVQDVFLTSIPEQEINW